jgi:hypothetical protein
MRCERSLAARCSATDDRPRRTCRTPPAPGKGARPITRITRPGAFGRRITQDEILKIIAYVRSLKKK